MQTKSAFQQFSVSSVIVINRRLPAAPPIKYGLGYRSRTRILTLTPTRNPTLTLKVTIMYAVQNDSEIKFNTVLQNKSYFRTAGAGAYKAYNRKAGTTDELIYVYD